MNIRNTLFLAGLTTFLTACVVTPYPVSHRDYDQRYDDDYYDYRNTPSYEGYYYARIIFIRDIPYYVDDDRYIRPIPPRMYEHFRRYPYNTLRHPPEFGHDNETRDGYRMSRIVYLNGVPYNVDNNRYAQPLPENLHQRFRHPQENMGRPPQASGQHDNGRNGEVPAFGRDRPRDQNRDEHGQYGRERDDQDQARDRDERRPNGWRNRIDQPPSERAPRDGEGNTSADSGGRAAPFPDRRGPSARQEQPNDGESRTDAPNGRERNRDRTPPQATDNSDKSTTDKKDNGKKSRSGKNDEQQDKRHGNGNRDN